MRVDLATQVHVNCYTSTGIVSSSLKAAQFQLLHLSTYYSSDALLHSSCSMQSNVYSVSNAKNILDIMYVTRSTKRFL